MKETEPETLEEKIIEDIIWEQTTPLKGWEKIKAFMERVKEEPAESEEV